MNGPQNSNSFRIVKSQPKSFKNFQENFLLKHHENLESPKTFRDTTFTLKYKPSRASNEDFQVNKATKSKINLPLGSPKEESKIQASVNENLDSILNSFTEKNNKKQISLNISEDKSFPSQSPECKHSKFFKHDNLNNIEKENNLLEKHMKKEDSTVIPFVKKFIYILKNACSLRDISQLKTTNFTLLSDASYFHGDLLKSREILKSKGLKKAKLKIKNFYESKVYKLKKIWWIRKIRHFIKGNILVLHPYQNLKILWDMIHLFLIIIWFIYIPILMAFEEIRGSDTDLPFCTIIFLIVDIFLNFNTSYFKNGVVEVKRKKIFVNYFNQKIFYDFITLLPISLNVIFISQSLNEKLNGEKTSPLYFINYLFFFKITTLKEIIQRILEKFLLKEKFQNILALFKVFFISFLVAHLFACFWYFTTSFANSAETWVTRANIIDSSWDIKYTYSLYWASLTMMTVGYGDIIPENEIELIVCLVTVLLGCVVYAYNINSIGIILQDLNKENTEFDHKINIINQFMKRKFINNDLQMRIREYLRFIWKEENTQNLEDEQKIIGSLSSSLKEELLIEAYGTILKKFPMFYANFSENSLKKVVRIIKDIKLFPEEKIFNEKEEDDLAIYFIMKGKVELYTEAGIVVSELGVGDLFGEISFFSGKSRGLSARTKDFTTLFSINRKEFIQVLMKNNDDYEKFCMIQDQIILYQNYLPLKLRCFSCSQIGHLANQCHLIHFLPDNEKIIKKHNFYLDQERSCDYLRKKTKKNAFAHKNIILMASKKIKEEIQKEKNNLEKIKGVDASFNSTDPELDETEEFYENENYTEANEPEDENSKVSIENDNITQTNKKESEIEIQPEKEKDILLNLNSLVEMKNFEKNDGNSPKHRFKAQINRIESVPQIKKSEGNISKLHNTAFIKDNLEMTKISSVSHIKYPQTYENPIADNSTFINQDISIMKNLGKARDEFEKKNNRNNAVPQSLSFSQSKVIKNSFVNENTQIPIEKPINNNNNNLMDSFDKVTNFKNYFPHNNCNWLLEEDNFKKSQKKYTSNKLLNHRKKSDERRITKYTFFVEEMKQKMPYAMRKHSKFKAKKEDVERIDEKFSNMKSIALKRRPTKYFGNFTDLFHLQKFSDVVTLLMKNPILKKQIKKKGKKIERH